MGKATHGPALPLHQKESELVKRFKQDRQAIGGLQVSIRAAVHQASGSSAGHHALLDLAARGPEVFFDAAFELVDPALEDPADAGMCVSLCGCPVFLIQLTRPDRFGRAKLIEVCRRFAAVDKRLDIRLADLLPGRHDDKYALAPFAVVRILDVLNEISVGPRLVLILNHLTEHSNPLVREKAVVLMGRRICNAAWPLRHLASSEPGVRASAVEALWGRNTTTARDSMWGCTSDDNERVVGNAIFGLHLLGEDRAGELVTNMLDDSRAPFRSTAARIMGKIGKEEFTELLTQAATDTDPGVRLEAKRALVAIRHPLVLQQQLAAAKAPPAIPQGPVPAPPPAEKPAAVPVDTDAPDLPTIRLDGKYVFSH